MEEEEPCRRVVSCRGSRLGQVVCVCVCVGGGGGA